MLFTGEDILSRFEKLIEKATRIHIATAWATPGSALNALKQKKGLEVRAIVGTYGNATEPSALERLKKLGELRLVGNEALFHPKIYVFEFRGRKPVAWVGSANFTGSGFGGGNVETIYETKDVEPFRDWFRQQWSQLEPATEEAINKYRERRGRKPPKRVLVKLVDEPEGAVSKPSLLPGAQDWKPVLKRKEIRSAFAKMHKTLIGGAEKLRDRGGRDPKSMYWRADLEYWCAFRDPDTRRDRGRQGYWNGFGQANPDNPEDGQTLILELNPPFDGNSDHAGSCAGLFVRNDRGNVFLARNLNKVPGVSAGDLERRLKERWRGRVVDVPWRNGTRRRMVVLDEVGSDELRNSVAKLIRLVAELRGTAGD